MSATDATFADDPLIAPATWRAIRRWVCAVVLLAVGYQVFMQWVDHGTAAENGTPPPRED